jgi:hypothetical protein
MKAIGQTTSYKLHSQREAERQNERTNRKTIIPYYRMRGIQILSTKLR